MPKFQILQKSDKVILDFVGANVAKKLHAGHMRNLNIGESLRRILTLKYPNLLADNHWGDWGVNIGVLIWGWKERGNLENYQKNPIEELSRVYVWSNSQKEITENWEKLVRTEFVKLEQKNEENLKLWEDFIVATKNNLKLDLDLMSVPPLEMEQGESFYEKDVRILWDFLEKYEIWEKEGLARFFDFEKMAEGLAKSLETSLETSLENNLENNLEKFDESLELQKNENSEMQKFKPNFNDDFQNSNSKFQREIQQNQKDWQKIKKEIENQPISVLKCEILENKDCQITKSENGDNQKIDLKSGKLEKNLEKNFETLAKLNLENKNQFQNQVNSKLILNSQTSKTNSQIEKIKKLKNLGRCYLVSSSGYTSYAFRDVAARIQWARDLEASLMITITGNEQIHHFEQVFAICEHISGLLKFLDFFGETTSGRLKSENLVHIPYGFLTLSDGKMSSRKGNVLTIRELFDQVQAVALANLLAKNQQKNQKDSDTLKDQEKLEINIKENNLEKLENAKNLKNTQENLVWKSQKITLAALKWYDLNRSASENLVLNIGEILNFAGNTGVYQLYTFARIQNILKKCQIQENQKNLGNQLEKLETEKLEENVKKLETKIDLETLNLSEMVILKKLYLTEIILEKICVSFKPHLLCNHLFELCTLINSWYGNHSVATETNPKRYQTLLVFCAKISFYLRESLYLLGIEVLEDL